MRITKAIYIKDATIKNVNAGLLYFTTHDVPEKAIVEIQDYYEAGGLLLRVSYEEKD